MSETDPNAADGTSEADADDAPVVRFGPMLSTPSEPGQRYSY